MARTLNANRKVRRMGVLSFHGDPNCNLQEAAKPGACSVHEVYQDRCADRTCGDDFFHPVDFSAGGEGAVDLDEAVLYRLAFGLADQLREARGYDCQRGRY